jgi:putative restriction endonuclease
LASDDNGAIWQLEGPSRILDRPRGATPTLTELRQWGISGGFSIAVQETLGSDPELLQAIARRILDAHFPQTLHSDILAAVGLSLEDEKKLRSGTAEYSRRSRDPGFRERVLRAYEYRCCVCGYDLRLGQQTIGLEAAHIKWFQAGGPDIERNGLSLCALHHKIFDLGAFTVQPTDFRIVFSQHVSGHDSTGQALLAKQGAKILHPQSDDFLPEADYLGWHQEQVFKRPARAL